MYTQEIIETLEGLLEGLEGHYCSEAFLFDWFSESEWWRRGYIKSGLEDCLLEIEALELAIRHLKGV